MFRTPRFWPLTTLIPLLVAATFFRLTAATAISADTTKPVIQSFSFTPTTGDVSNAPLIVEVTANVTDAESGVAFGLMNFYSPSGNQWIQAFLSFHSGTPQNAVWKTTIEIPRLAETGNWVVGSARFDDAAGNMGLYFQPGKGAPSYPAASNVPLVITGNTDATRPVIQSFSFTPTTGSVSNGPLRVEVTARVTDTGSGVTFGLMNFYSPSGTWIQAFLSFDSGTPFDAVYKTTIEIPHLAETGNWRVGSVRFDDAAGNMGIYYQPGTGIPSYPAASNVPLVITGNSDPTPPVMQSLTFAPSRIDTTTGNASVLVSGRFTDALSGVGFIYVWLESPSGNQSVTCYPTLVAGTAQDGTFEDYIQIPQSAETGPWRLRFVRVDDAAGNSVVYRRAGQGTPVIPPAVDLPLQVNAPPVAQGASITAQEDIAKLLNLTATDADGDPLTYSIVNPPQHGAISYTAPNFFYTPAGHFHGSDSFSFKVNDGLAESNVATVTLTVLPLNDPPSFSPGQEQIVVLEDSGPCTIAGWATQIKSGPLNEADQALQFIVVADTPALFAVPPAIDLEGNLTFTPAPHAVGQSMVIVRLKDNGGTDNGGNDTSWESYLWISMSPVNDPPVFTSGGDVAVAQDSGPQTIPGWATGVSAGPLDEVSQALQFEVGIDRPELFLVPPALAVDGTLSFVPAPSASGVATATVVLRDNGGTDDGGIDSTTKAFRIAITTQAEEAGTYHGLIQPAPATAPEVDSTGSIRLVMNSDGRFTGKLRMGRWTHQIRGFFDKAGIAQFGKPSSSQTILTRRGFTPLALQLSLDVSGGTDKLTGVILKDGEPFAVVEADRELYTARPNPVAPFRAVPIELVGNYTIALASTAEDSSSPGMLLGDGVGIVSAQTTGAIRFRAVLADGTRISAASVLSKQNAWPLYIPFARARGCLSGMIQFSDVPQESDLAGSLRWHKPAAASPQLFPSGWPDGIKTELIGSRFIRMNGAALPGLGPLAASGNAQLTLQAAGEEPFDLLQLLNIDARSRVTAVLPNPHRLSLRVQSTGLFNGQFIHPTLRRPVQLRGAILQKQSRGTGFYLGKSESGSVGLLPRP